MAKRPVFIPQLTGDYLVKTEIVDFTYYSGFALSNKQKSIEALHEAAQENFGHSKILEISSKSQESLGVSLSAFNLMIADVKTNKCFSVECAFQSSKVFENDIQYTDLLTVSSRDAKKDERIRNSGTLKKFRFYGVEWELTPLTAFYDWLYVNTLNRNQQYHEQLVQYNAFTDIEFNPKKSINCQAYSTAMFVALARRGLLTNIKDRTEFLKFYTNFSVSNAYKSDEGQAGSLF